MGLYNDVMFTEALEQVEALVSSDNANEISTRIEKIVAIPDLSMICMMILTLKARGVDTSSMTGIELANVQPSFSDLVIPSRFIDEIRKDG